MKNEKWKHGKHGKLKNGKMKKKERGYNKPNGNIKGCIQERLLTPMTHYDKCLIINQEKNYALHL